MARAIFRDRDLQEIFDEKGWVQVDLLEKDEVDHLLKFYADLPQEKLPEYGFHVSLDKQNKETKRRAVEELIKVIGPKAGKWFENYKVFTAAYVVKESNPKGMVPPHQDWTFVDESQFNSVTVWTPLLDVDMDNGCMGVINGSHKFSQYRRSSPSPQCKMPISDHMFTIFPYLQLVPMKAGQALIFDNRTIHASPPNTTDTPRIAAGIGVTQEEAELIHYYLTPESKPPILEMYKADLDFFLNWSNSSLSDLYNQGKKPDNVTLLGTAPRILPEFSPDDILDLIKSHPDNQMNIPLVEKLAKLFNYNLDGTKKEKPPEPIAAQEPAKGIRGIIKRIFG